MRCIKINLSNYGGSLSEAILDNQILKALPYSSKQEYACEGNYTEQQYSNILVPVNLCTDDGYDYFISQTMNINWSNFDLDVVLKSLYNIMKGTKIFAHFSKIFIDVLDIVNTDDLQILYSDGSIKKETSKASFAVCQLKEKSDAGGLETFSNELYDFDVYSGTIENGTNNIGELSGIKKAVELLRSSKDALIISDSEYSIKTFREWLYEWKKKGYKNSIKKEIKNKALIMQIESMMRGFSANIYFKWTKGHANDFFNEVCDKYAKSALED